MFQVRDINEGNKGGYIVSEQIALTTTKYSDWN